MVCVIYKLCKVKFTGVIKLEAGNAIHRLCRKIRVCFELVDNLLLGGRKRTLKAADNRHWNNDILIFVATVRSAQFVSDGPDKIYFGGYINGRIIPHCVYNLLISHLPFTSLRSCSAILPLFYTRYCPIIRTLCAVRSSFYNADSDRVHQKSSGTHACMLQRPHSPPHNSSRH